VPSPPPPTAAKSHVQLISDTAIVACDTVIVSYDTVIVKYVMMSVSYDTVSVSYDTVSVAYDTVSVPYVTASVANDTVSVANDTATKRSRSSLIDPGLMDYEFGGFDPGESFIFRTVALDQKGGELAVSNLVPVTVPAEK